MTQQSGNQFEDDLTMGLDEDRSFTTDSIDLLGLSGDENSPIARLKTIILSIDWEINDDILQQLDDELHDLGEIWSSDKIKQVYVQGLSKIGRYIYKEKAGAHPNSIKLLITFYHNLEKIVTNEDSMSEGEKKQLLLADVRKFDQLKSQIGKPAESSEPPRPATVTVATEEAAPVAGFSQEPADVLELKTLKAQVLGIDWEINDREIGKLGNEVKRLESVFSQSKAKLILLQGIGALSSYINKKRSQSNSGAFSLLHSFYASLETISGNDLSAADEKKLLLSEVSKFNAFKAEITTEKESPAAVVSDAGSAIESAETFSDSPAALSDSPASLSDDGPVAGIEDESSDDAAVVAADVTSRLSSVFGEDELEESTSYQDSDETEALAGVDVETEADDDSGEAALPYEEGSVAPALTDVDEDSSFSVEKLADDLSVAAPTKTVEAIVGDDIEEDDEFTLEDTDEPVNDLTSEEIVEDVPEKEELLQGVDVETEADDDSAEESLPMEGDELAPALSGAADESGFNADTMSSEFDQSDTEAIEDRLGSFFDDEVAMSSEGWVSETSGVLPEPQETAIETETEIEAEIESDSDVNDGIIAALSEFKEESPAVEDDFDDIAEQETIETVELTEQILEEGIETEDVEETTFEDQTIFDDDPAPALFDSEEDILTEDIDDNKESYESEEAFVEDGLSFLDDDIDDEPEEIFVEEKEPESDTEGSLAFLDDDTASFDASESEDVEESVIEELFEADEKEPASPIAESAFDDVPVIEDKDVEETAGEDVFDFFDDVEEPAEESTDYAENADEIAFEVEAEDIEEDDEIEFTVPGEDKESVTEEILEIEDTEEEIGFAIPGEIAAPVVAVAAAVAMSETQETEEPDDFIETKATKEDEEVIFEAVADDVELDLLPGEEFDDSVLLDDDTGIQVTEEELVEFTAVEEDLDTGRYESLGILVTAVHDNVGDDGIQDLFSEINKLRSSKDTSYSDKTFLQILSTVSQFVDQNRNDSRGLSLLKEIASGLEMSDSSDVSDAAVQEKLFTCTSQALLLRAKDKAVPVVEPEEVIVQESEVEVEIDDIVEDTEDKDDTSNYTLKGEDEQLASFVQKELADIRKLFVEEIGNLRKELADKK